MFLSPTQIVSKLKLKKGDRVADFGCGVGGYLALLSEAVGRTGKVFALDLNENLLERLKLEAQKYGYDNLEFGVCDLLERSFLENKSCDLVILSNLLHQVDDQVRVILEAKRVLKNEGLLLIVDWKDHFKNKKIGPHPNHFVPEEKILAILAKNNLEVLRHLPAGDYHYAFLAA